MHFHFFFFERNKEESFFEPESAKTPKPGKMPKRGKERQDDGTTDTPIPLKERSLGRMASTSTSHFLSSETEILVAIGTEEDRIERFFTRNT